MWWNVRLPKNIVPVHYDVLLNIDLKKLEFYGNVEILVNVSTSTENVLVHVHKMNITSVSVEQASDGGWKLFIHILTFVKRPYFFVIHILACNNFLFVSWIRKILKR